MKTYKKELMEKAGAFSLMIHNLKRTSKCMIEDRKREHKQCFEEYCICFMMLVGKVAELIEKIIDILTFHLQQMYQTKATNLNKRKEIFPSMVLPRNNSWLCFETLL